MSYEDGWAALNLEMTSRVPRTEHSADGHWELVSAVTGMKVSVESDPEVRRTASREFCRKWNYDLFWSIHVGGSEFGKLRAKMGHAQFAAGGTDFSRDTQCAFKTPEEVLAFDPWESLGKKDHRTLVERFEKHYRDQMANNDPIGVRMTGVYITIISGLIELFGWDMLLFGFGTDPVKFGAMTNRYASWIQQYFDAMADSNVPVIMVHDDIVWSSGPFLDPAWYREYVFPNYKKLFRPLLDSKKKVLYTSDGDYTAFIDDVADCGIHGFIMEPMTDMEYIAEKYGKTLMFSGNADTRILLTGTKDEIRREVERCMRIGKKCPGFIMSVGNHIPSNTPVENALYYNEVYEELSRR